MALFFLPHALLGNTLIVSPEGPYTSIHSAIAAAENGDRIRVLPGVYREGNISVNKTVHIAGENWPVIDGENQFEIFTVTANGVVIEGLLLKNVGVSFIHDNAGIKLDSVSNCVIRNNKLYDNFFAIYLARSWDCLVENNEIISHATRETTSGNGIHLWYCKNITIRNNHISGHRDGIYFEFVQLGRITNNLSEHNLRYGLHFMFSDSCHYSGNTFRNNGAGVAVMYTHKVRMVDNLFEDNWGAASFGLLLKEITDSHIYKNTFYRNSIGLYSEASNRNLIERNNFVQNGWAVKLMANSMDNRFISNNFENNSFEVATNSRQNFSLFEGNYWSGYRGYDLNRDGIGDVPYRPVSLFSYLVEQNPPGLILLRSFFIQILNMAEKIIPALTPETLIDQKPLMRRIS